MTAPLTQTTGRRKRAVARAALRPGTGQFTINGKTLEAYFPTDASQMVVSEPMNVTETRESYDVAATIHGGGSSGQAGALRMAIAPLARGTRPRGPQPAQGRRSAHA